MARFASTTITGARSSPALAVEPRESRWKRVLPLLRRAILSGELLPGTRLVPEQLAQGSGVSRGPVVDAIKRLAEEGLVTIQPNGRSFVRGLTRKDLQDLSLFRANLEMFAVRTALAHGQTPDLTPLGASVEAMRHYQARPDMDYLADADVSFHQQLIALGDNGFANHAWAPIADFTRSLLSVSDLLITRDRLVASTHEAIVDAVAARDVAAVEAAIAAHYRLSLELMTGASLLRTWTGGRNLS